MQNKQVIAADEMVDKIKAAVDARMDEKTVLIIRTDSDYREEYRILS